MRNPERSFKDRKRCLVKKSIELSKLMGVDVCLTIVDPTTKNISEYKSDEFEDSIKNSQQYIRK